MLIAISRSLQLRTKLLGSNLGQNRGSDRLNQVIDRPQTDGPFDIVRPIRPRKHHGSHPHPFVVIPQPLQDFETVHQRHRDIEQEQPWWPLGRGGFRCRELLDEFHEFRAVAEAKQGILDFSLPNGAAQEVEIVVVIFRNQDGRHVLHGSIIVKPRILDTGSTPHADRAKWTRICAVVGFAACHLNMRHGRSSRHSIARLELNYGQLLSA